MANLKELFEGLNTTEKIDNSDLVKTLQDERKKAKEEQLYYVLHVNRGFDNSNFVVADNLTEEEARDMLQKDMKVNPKAHEYMWVSKKQLN